MTQQEEPIDFVRTLRTALFESDDEVDRVADLSDAISLAKQPLLYQTVRTRP